MSPQETCYSGPSERASEGRKKGARLKITHRPGIQARAARGALKEKRLPERKQDFPSLEMEKEKKHEKDKENKN